MKKYVYTKGESSITVETDAFGSIDNFVVTGIFSVKAEEIINSGFDIQTGYPVTKAKMLNLAKACECQLDVYGANDVKESDEDVDFIPSLKDLKLGIAKDENTYNQLVPEEYRKSNTWGTVSSKAPFLVATFNRIDVNDKYEMTVKAKSGVASADTDVVFASGVAPTWGTLSESDKVLTTDKKEYLVFSIATDLQISDGITTNKKFKLEINYQEEDYSAEVTAS